MSSNKIVRIKSLPDFVRCISALKPLSEHIPLMKEEIFFRGLYNKEYLLRPSLCRFPSTNWMNSLQNKEHSLIEKAQQKYPSLFSCQDYPAILLAKLQHYGIPTRMMDVTSNALVALYFACQPSSASKASDGEVVAFSSYVYTAFNPYINAIADTAAITGNAYMNMETFYYRVSMQPYYRNQSYPNESKKLKQRTESFSKIISKPLLFDPGDVCERQKNQQGKFIIFPNKTATDDEGILHTFEELTILEKHDRMVVKRIIIPNQLKEQILRDLRYFGITNEYLFSDSVDTVCQCITEEQKGLYQEELN